MSLSDRFFGGPGGELHKPSAATLFPGAQVVVVVLVAVAFRLLYWRLASGSAFMHTPVVDGSFFDIWARTLSEGRVFQDQPFFKPPLYAYLLSFFYRMGLGMSGVFALQMIVGAISCVLTLAIGRIVCRPRVAFAGAVITALLPILPFFESQLLAESWTLALTLGALVPVLLVISGQVRPRARHFALAGALLGVAAMGRPNLMLLVVLLTGCLWWWGRGGGRVRPMGVMPLLAGFLIAISPATLYNAKHGEFTLISANLGVNLYTGQSDIADGVSAIPVGVVWDDLQLRSRLAGAGGPGASSRFLTSETLAWMSRNPGRTLGLWWKKAVLVCNGLEARNNINPMWLAQQDGVFLLARWWPATWLMLPFAMVGLVWFGRGSASAWLLKWVVLSQAVAILPFFVTARFRAPLLPLLALFAAAGFVVLWRAAGERRWVPLLALAAALVVVNVDWYGLGDERWLARDHLNQGLINTRPYAGRVPDLNLAAEHFQRAVALDADDVDANERYGALFLGQAQPLLAEGEKLVSQGRIAAAESTYSRADYFLVNAQKYHTQATRIFPRSYRSWSNLGTCQMWLADVQASRSRISLEAGESKAAASFAMDALARYEDATNSLQASLKVNRSQQDVRRQIQIVWRRVLELPNLNPTIGRVQEQLKHQLEGGQ